MRQDWWCSKSSFSSATTRRSRRPPRCGASARSARPPPWPRYLGRYLYRGVIQEADILRCEDGKVTFQYCDAKTGKRAVRTLDGAEFLWLVLQHVLPKGLRRSRNFGFLHPNSAAAIRLLQVLHLRAVPSAGARADARAGACAGASASPSRPPWRCVCGQPMRVLRRRVPTPQADGQPAIAQRRVDLPDRPTNPGTHTMH